MPKSSKTLFSLTVKELQEILREKNVQGRTKLRTKKDMVEEIEKLNQASKPLSNKKTASTKSSSKKTASTKSNSKKVANKKATLNKNKSNAIQAEASKINANKLLKQGFEPIHKADEAKEALNYLRNLIIKFPRTTQCTGVSDISGWFQYVTKQEQFHPSIFSTRLLELVVDIYDKKVIVYNSKKEFKKIKQEIESHPNENIVIPVGFSVEGVGRHANMILLNRSRKHYEWFEPHGIQDWEGKEKQRQIREKDEKPDAFNTTFQLIREFMQSEEGLKTTLEIPNNYSLDLPYDICPSALFVKGPQAKQRHNAESCPDGGYCLTHATIYAHLRLLAPAANPIETVNAFMDQSNEQILDFILHYIGWQNAAGFE